MTRYVDMRRERWGREGSTADVPSNSKRLVCVTTSLKDVMSSEVNSRS